MTSLPLPLRERRALSLPSAVTETCWYLASLGLLIAIWETVARLVEPTFLPPFTDVVGRLVTELQDGPLLEYLLSSLSNLAIGFGVSAVGGVVIGTLMGLFRPIEIALDPYVYAAMTAPSVAFVPIYFALFGLSRWTIIALIVQYASFVIVVDTTTAVRQVRPQLVDMARVFGASRWQVVRHVVFRSALPLTMTGLRLGLGRSVKGMVNGELLIALVGIGGAIVRYGGRFDAEGVLALVLLVVGVSLVLLKSFSALDKRVNGWVG